MKRNAFSLVELLIVLAIIAILAALLFAAFGPAREKARQSVCTSNLHQIREALAMYQADYDGADPTEGVPMQNWQLGLPSGPNACYTFMTTYIKDLRIMTCPDYIPPTAQKRLSTYAWCFPDEKYMPKNLKFSRIVAQMGQDTPLFICEAHNRPLDLANEPRWTQKQVIILRYNGQVKVKTVAVRDKYPY